MRGGGGDPREGAGLGGPPPPAFTERERGFMRLALEQAGAAFEEGAAAAADCGGCCDAC